MAGVKNVDYRGCQTTTRTGKTCQNWTEQSPHPHTMSEANNPGTGIGDHNYCRNPDGGDTIWCYTTESEPASRWEYCDPISGTHEIFGGQFEENGQFGENDYFQKS